jgi:hypothetical protein
VVTGVPVGRPAASPGAPFDVFTPIRRPEQDTAQRTFPDEAPYAQSYPDFVGEASDASQVISTSDYGNSGPASTGLGNNGEADGGLGGRNAGDDHKGLPRRVRQASLAPELRASAVAGPIGSSGVPAASAESLSVMRNTLSAMQRGWQQGRSESQGDTEGNVDGD